MTIAHWLYVLGVLVVIATMILRRNVVIPCITFTFIIGLYFFGGNMVTAVQVVFNASLVAAKELLSIFLIIGFMVALLKSMQKERADEVIIKPMHKMMKGPLISYLILVIATVIISLFFWPTPAAPLLGALLVPAAIRAGLPPMMGAMAIALAGQGMTLASDAIIQAAPGLTASAAGIPVELVTSRVTFLSLITGIIAISLAWIMNKKDINTFNPQTYIEAAATKDAENSNNPESINFKKAKFISWLIVISMALVIICMFLFDIKGGDSSALLGGVALIIISVNSFISDGVSGLDTVADCIADGLVFAFKVMGPIIPIAGFFYLGSNDFAPAILAEGAPGYLFDIGQIIATAIPPTGFLAGFGLLALGAVTGLDGSGFSGLPVVGTLAGAMAGGDANIAATLGSIGQVSTIWFGGGTLVAWSSLVAVAGICGVPVLDLVRKNLIPVLAGLFVSAFVAILFMM